MRLINIETEIRDMFSLLKNVMLCISYVKLATLRAKAMKVIKKVIKMDPETLHEEEILKIIKLRLVDVSASTRETTLDLLYQTLTSQDRSSVFERSFLKHYLNIILERADDSSLCVRKKVVQLLSLLLSTTPQDCQI